VERGDDQITFFPMPPRFPSPTRLIRFLTAWMLLAALAATPAAAQDLVIRFFNVGQADAALITSPEGKTALIDGGDNNGNASYALYLLGVDSLDLIIASHNHADHIGGLTDIIRTSTVGAYMDNGVPMTTATYYNLSLMREARNVRYLEATPRTIQLGSVSLRILPRPPGDKSQNNNSVGVLLTYGSFTALFTGDAESKERKYWVANAKLPHIAVLKLSHHGALNGTDTTWLATTRPRVAVISVGANNTYGHPSSKTLRSLAAVGAQVYRTDLDGDITVAVDSLGAFTIQTSEPGPVRTWPAVPASHH
jgi:beta-lactamase superfamily II metal-dependent hydrolase